MREWKPGDVATDGVFPVLRSARGGFAYADGSFVADEARGILTYRPLVVIDPEDREQVGRLADAFYAMRGKSISSEPGVSSIDLQRMVVADALRSLTAPEPEPEPGSEFSDLLGSILDRLDRIEKRLGVDES